MHPPEKIGLIAGQGQIPQQLITRWVELGHVPVIAALKGVTDPALVDGKISEWFSVGQVGHILKFFQSQGVHRLVMIGAMNRPNFWTLRTDFLGLYLILKFLSHSIGSIGDDALLRLIRGEIEKKGMKVIGVHHFLPELLCPSGVLGDVQPDEDARVLIRIGFDAAKRHGALDRGQSVVVSPEGVIALEGRDGTNSMIAGCRGRLTPILVKVSKPQQDMDVDMPTIGPSTVENCHAAGFIGIAVESGHTLVTDRDAVLRLCNMYGMFLIGI